MQLTRGVWLPDGSIVVPTEATALRRKVFRRRWLARLVARANGYFWMPCPRCGENFSGKEWGTWGYPALPTRQDGSSSGICGPCAVETRQAYIRLLEAPSAQSRRGDDAACEVA